MRNLKIIVTALFLSLALLVNAQHREKREVQSFDKLDVFGNIQVEMKQGETESLQLFTKNVDPTDIKTEVKDKHLKISMKSNLFDDEAEVKIVLTYKEIREIYSNAAAEVKVIGVIKGDKIFANATSGGRILMEVDLNAIELKVYQGAHIDVSGKAKLQESFINTGGVLAASNFECDEVFIKMNTGGQAEIIVNKLLDANVNTGASLNYFGKPEQENINTALGGKISAWDKTEDIDKE